MHAHEQNRFAFCARGSQIIRSRGRWEIKSVFRSRSRFDISFYPGAGARQGIMMIIIIITAEAKAASRAKFANCSTLWAAAALNFKTNTSSLALCSNNSSEKAARKSWHRAVEESLLFWATAGECRSRDTNFLCGQVGAQVNKTPWP